MKCILIFFHLFLILTSTLPVAESIVGGTTAYAGQFAYSAAINVQTSNSRFFCGGTLISTQWILTAGQCVDGAILFTIQLGTHNLEEENAYRLDVATSEYALHPDYNPSTLENDIGLIELRIEIEYNDYVKNVGYLGSFDITSTSVLLAIGWGQTSDSEAGLSNDLKWVEVSSISNTECQMTYGNQINSNQLCVVGNYNEGTCYGDTGSALLLELSGSHKMHAGIASFISGNGCESTDPSGYIRTYPYRMWIRNVTGI